MPHDGGEIDDILCRHFELLDELERTLKELEVEQRKGYLSMSQARVAMGVNAVSLVSVPTEDLRATTLLTCCDELPVAPGSMLLSRAKSTSTPVLAKDVVEGMRPQVKSGAVVPDGADGRAGELRFRGNKSGKHSGVDKDPMMSNDDTGDTRGSIAPVNKSKAGAVSVTANDPLRWFGVLTSPALRSCQSSFNNVIELSIRASNIQVQLRHLREKSAKLRRRDDGKGALDPTTRKRSEGPLGKTEHQ